jgi:Domain of unknown function (DUF4157)/Bacterial protein of unknown function (DUF922)/NAD:arginine ADP-ribosyltransferase
VQQRARIRRAAERTEQRRYAPPAPTVAPPPDAGGAPANGADFSIATLSVLPDVTPVARKIQRQENDDHHPAPAPTPAPPANPPGDGADQLKAGGEGSTTILAPTVAFKVYSGKTLQEVSNALHQEAGSLTFDIGTATDGDPITRATVTVKQAMELPRWAERDVQCKPIQAAWDRFASALRQHEDDHVKINKQQLGSSHSRYVGRAKSETQDVTTELENETNAAGNAFDAQTNHGKTGSPPTTIDVGAKCDDKKTAGGMPEIIGPEEEELQTKLEVSQPGDPDEEEADRVAEQVMRMAEPREGASLRLVSGASVVQRCAACEAEEKKWQASPEAQSAGRVRRKCAECEAKEKAIEEEEEKKQVVARKEANGRSVSASSRVVDVTRSGGQPLDAETRAFMEPRFGFDFSRVRIHADSQATEAAESVNARAYTIGNSVVFGAGRYAPRTDEGQRLLAHELTHVVQQTHNESDQDVGRGVIARAVDASKAEPIRAELDSTFYVSNSNLESLWASLGLDLIDAVNDNRLLTSDTGKKKKKESYRDLWWRSTLDANINVTAASRPVLTAFATDTVQLAKSTLQSQQIRLQNLRRELKNAKEQNQSAAPPKEDFDKGMSVSGKPVASAKGLVDTATLVHFLENWEDILKSASIGMRRVDTSGLLPQPGPTSSTPSFTPFPNAPTGNTAPSGGGGSAAAPASAMEPILFDPAIPIEKIQAVPNVASVDRDAFESLNKAYKRCADQREAFKQTVQQLLSEDANLAVLHDRGELKRVSALGGQSDDEAASAMELVAKQNEERVTTFLNMLNEQGTVDWKALRPIHSHLLAGGAGGSRDWSELVVRTFVEGYFKREAEAQRAAAERQLQLNLVIGGVAFIAMLSPAAPLAAAVLAATSAYSAASLAGSLAQSSAADKKADVMSAGAAAGMVTKDDARRAKEDAEAKKVSGLEILLTVLPFIPGVVKGGGRVLGALGRLGWLRMAEAEAATIGRTAASASKTSTLRTVLGEARYAEYEQAINAIKAQHPELAKLPTEDLIAIRGYTAEDYAQLNSALRSGDPKELARLQDYIQKATGGLNSLPPVKARVNRAVSLTPDMRAPYQPGAVVTESAFISASMRGGKYQRGGNTVMIIESTSGRDISAIARHVTEKEVLFMPGTRFQVTSVEMNGNVIRMVDLGK